MAEGGGPVAKGQRDRVPRPAVFGGDGFAGPVGGPQFGEAEIALFSGVEDLWAPGADTLRDYISLRLLNKKLGGNGCRNKGRKENKLEEETFQLTGRSFP